MRSDRASRPPEPAKLTGTRNEWAVHPVLIALFPIVSLYSTHIGQVGLGELAAPVVLTLVACAGLWVLARAILRDRHERGLVLTLVYTLFLNAHACLGLLQSASGSAPSTMLATPAAILAVVAFGLCAVWLYARRHVRLVDVTRFLNRASAIGITVALGTGGYWIARQAQLEPPSVSMDASAPTPGDAPDIYYLLLDSYTSPAYLRDEFQFDNSDFVDALRSRGFFVPDDSRSNYSTTQHSLASSLNLNYLHELVPGATRQTRVPAPLLAKLVQRSAVTAFLREREYQFVAFASGLTLTQVRDADEYLEPANRHGLTEFQGVLLSRTPLGWAFRGTPAQEEGRRWGPTFKDRGVPFILETLPKLAKRPGRLFVFAHVFAPHPPHRLALPGEEPTGPRPFRAGYLAEVRYLNQHLLQAVDGILAASPRSVIVIQGDHGPWSDYYQGLTAWPGSREGLIRERTQILTAVYVPGDRPADAVFYQSVSPVNIFRRLFNHSFGVELTQLPDDSCVCWWDDCKESFWTSSPAPVRGSPVVGLRMSPDAGRALLDAGDSAGEGSGRRALDGAGSH